MNINFEYPVRIYKSIRNDNVFYSAGLVRKDKEGNYINGYITCQFRNGVELDNKAKIYIKNAWLTFYLRKEEFDGVAKNVTVPYIFISEFETIEETIEAAKVEVEENAEDPFKDFGEELTLTDDDLPF